MKTLKTLATCIALATAAAALTGCAGFTPWAKAKTAPAAKVPAGILTGKVLETLDSGGYTYINLEKDGKSFWVAAPSMKVAVGQEVQLLSGAAMTNFSSKTLNRSFDSIIFSGGVYQPQAPGASPAPLNLPHMPGAPAVDPNAASFEESEEVIMTGKVIETMNAASYTYVRVGKDGKASWAAVPLTTLTVDDEIELQPGTPMGKFTSKMLNRSFDTIYFASGLKVTSQKTPAAAEPAANAAALPTGHPKLDAAAAPLPTGHPKLDAAPQAAPAPLPPIAGKVVETANAGGYTYLCLEKDGVKSWVAVPTMQAKLGQELKLAPGNVMTNFVSKSLNRTFDKIIFSSGPAQ